MEQKQIKDLMAAMVRYDMTRVAIKQDNVEVELERALPDAHAASIPQMYIAPQQMSHSSEHSTATENGPTLQEPSGKKEAAAIDKSIYVTSPMVGTFYSSPSPDEPSFIKPGDRIEKGTVVCIIEAMKVMNEVKASVSGTVVELLVENGHPVEFGTKLVKVL